MGTDVRLVAGLEEGLEGRILRVLEACLGFILV